ncbi:stigma-specific STIG1 family protein [Tanacetum coccineum]|uniref:Stigma-specific STIG1 family protein n=1 Tax=Tanacetum coccineum TaxID=301880 RepID=A0ABQ4WE91_9ASTR
MNTLNTLDQPPTVSASRPASVSFATLLQGDLSRKGLNFRTLTTQAGNEWNPYVNLMKEDVGNVPVWVKIHGVLVTASSEDGVSVIATKLGTPLMLNSYTSDMCACCKVFGHVPDECPRNTDSGVAKNLKKPSQAPIGVSVGPKVGFKPAKQVYRSVFKKTKTNTSGNKKKEVEPTKEVSNSNPFNVLNSIKNDVDLGTNGRTSNLASKKANSSGSSFWNVESSSTSTTPIVEKIDKIERLIINGKVTLVDDEDKRLENVDLLGNHDSEDEVDQLITKWQVFLALRKVGYGTNSLLEQWKET